MIYLEIKNIIFPTPLDEIKDINNDNVDVFVELEDGNTYTLVFITLANILHLMEQNGKDYFEAGPSMVIVKELSADVIKSALLSFCDGNAYWLKEYYLSGDFDISVLDKMVNELRER